MKLKYIKNPNIIADLQKGWEIRDNGVKIRLVNTLGFSKFEYNSLEDFNREWKTLKEPLLKGKLRESLKMWADYHRVNKLRYIEGEKYSKFEFYDQVISLYIDYEISTHLYELESGKVYELTDLVGE